MQAKILIFIGSKKFLYVITGVFVFEALWIALTGRYPGAFDENFHLGLIQLYAKHWLPFLDAQPPNAGVYGAVARDPSYLYHYVMSFPYRLFALFVHNQTAQIVYLRVLNVGLVTIGIFLYARLLRRTSLPGLAQNAIMVLFTMVPVLPLLAGQINYDSLLFIFVAIAILLTLDIADAVRAGRFELTTLAKLLAVSMLASLTKYAFLPIFAGIVLYVGVVLVRHRHTVGVLHPGRLMRYVSRAPKTHLVFYSLLVIVSAGLFFQRYGINTLRYHTPVPDCAQVITIKECSAYAPWQRDYVLAQTNTNWQRVSVVTYTDMWVHQMVRETYFTVYGAFFPDGTVDYKVADPLPLMTILGWTLLIGGALATLLSLPKLWRNPMLQLFATVTILYVFALFIQNLKAYRNTAVPVSIHGRYLLPLLPLLLVISFYAYRELFRSITARFDRVRKYRTSTLLVSWGMLLIFCLQGGGIITTIVRSDPQWFWQQSTHAQKANDKARKVLRPLVIQHKL